MYKDIPLSFAISAAGQELIRAADEIMVIDDETGENCELFIRMQVIFHPYPSPAVQRRQVVIVASQGEFKVARAIVNRAKNLAA